MVLNGVVLITQETSELPLQTKSWDIREGTHNAPSTFPIYICFTDGINNICYIAKLSGIRTTGKHRSFPAQIRETKIISGHSEISLLIAETTDWEGRAKKNTSHQILPFAFFLQVKTQCFPYYFHGLLVLSWRTEKVKLLEALRFLYCVNHQIPFLFFDRPKGSIWYPQFIEEQMSLGSRLCW